MPRPRKVDLSLTCLIFAHRTTLSVLPEPRATESCRTSKLCHSRADELLQTPVQGKRLPAALLRTWLNGIPVGWLKVTNGNPCGIILVGWLKATGGSPFGTTRKGITEVLEGVTVEAKALRARVRVGYGVAMYTRGGFCRKLCCIVT